MKKKRVIVCGAGSIGIYLGTMIYSKNNDVKLFGKRKLQTVCDEIKINDKTFDTPEKIFTLPKKERYDFIFITPKLYDLDSVMKKIKKSGIKGKHIIFIQNGIVDVSKYSNLLGKRIVPVVVFSGLNLIKGNIVVNTTKTGWVIEDSKEGKVISKFIRDSGIPCYTHRDFDSLRAEKSLVNCCLNALSAIEGKSFYELFKDKKTEERIWNLFDECYEVLKKEHSLDKKERIKKRILRDWSKLNHYSSTYQDIKSGRKNEVVFFNGYIVKLGKKYKLSTLYNEKILNEMRKIKKR